MSLSKLGFLVTLVVFAAAPGFDLPTSNVDVLTSNFSPFHPAAPSDESRWRAGGSSNFVPSNFLFPAKPEIPSAAFLPVQSQNPKDLGTGKLLVASRSLGDPNFIKTVILLVRCDTDGVVGLVLNRRTNVPLSQVLDLESAKSRSDPVYLGGPVETQAVFALLRSKDKLDGAEPVFSGVDLLSTKAPFEKAISGQPDPGSFHVYLGYAGWNNEQLRMELKLGSWFIFQGDAKTVFDSDPDSLWRQMIQKTELQFAGSGPRPLIPTTRSKHNLLLSSIFRRHSAPSR
jgi:putative transcriptional regulator